MLPIEEHIFCGFQFLFLMHSSSIILVRISDLIVMQEDSIVMREEFSILLSTNTIIEFGEIR